MARQISAHPIVTSSLLRTPAMEQLKAEGRLVGDYEVLRTLLNELLNPKYRSGAVVDGFPRTAIQVEFLRLLRDNMVELQLKYSLTPLASRFLRPAFRIIGKNIFYYI
jgi:adenylate kinase